VTWRRTVGRWASRRGRRGDGWGRCRWLGAMATYVPGHGERLDLPDRRVGAVRSPWDPQADLPQMHGAGPGGGAEPKVTALRPNVQHRGCGHL